MQKISKLNSSIDIIPLQSSSGEVTRFAERRKANNELGYKQFRDPHILARVQNYLYENINKVYIDVNDMADFLQKKYRDYRGKKQGPFRAMVRKAYDEVTESLTQKSTSTSWQKDDEVDVESDSHDYLNNELLNMYKRSLPQRNGNSSDKELIDISSDDDQNNAASAPSKRVRKDEHEDVKDDSKSSPVKSESDSPESPPPVARDETAIVERPVKKRQREKSFNSGPMFMKKRKEVPIVYSKYKFADIGGIEKVLQTVCKLLVHMKHPEVFQQLGIPSPRGFLLHGPPGCGKTLLAHAIAGELEMPLLKVAGPELIAGVSGESESRIRELFEQAKAIAPCILFIDEIDVLASHRANAQKEMERRIVAQLLSCLDELNMNEEDDRVLLIGATNRPDSLDPALRRAGRFDREVSLGIPDKDARYGILRVHTAKVELSDDVNLQEIASLTPGFVGADLVALIREAAIVAVNRVFEELRRVQLKEPETIEEPTPAADKPKEQDPKDSKSDENVEEVVEASKAPPEADESSVVIEAEIAEDKAPEESKIVDENVEMAEVPEKPDLPKEDLSGLLSWLRNEPLIPKEKLAGLCVNAEDFTVALQVVQPSAKREGFATVPDVTWNDVGSLRDIRQELQMAILAPVRHSAVFETLGLSTSSGVLLCGPPGCGKTLLAKAIANEAGINFISVKGPELLNMYVGESEKAVRQCFTRARNSVPCVIFFDELDALCPTRSQGDNPATSRVVNQMLTEMDGIDGRKGVFLMAATNRPDIIDPAVIRPGRLEKILYVGLPTPDDRVDILRALTKNGTKPKLALDVNLEEVGRSDRCDGYTGADLAALIREAGMEAIREIVDFTSVVTEISIRHINVAFNKVKPSVHEKDIKHYEKLRKMYSYSRKDAEVTPMETPVEQETVPQAMET